MNCRRSRFLEVGRDGKSFRSKDRALGEARATCGADPFSNRSVHHRSRFRSYRAMDETTRLGGGDVLQLVGGRNFNAARSRHWSARMAVPTRVIEEHGKRLGSRNESSMPVNKEFTSRKSPIRTSEVELLELLSRRRAFEGRDREIACSDAKALALGIRNALLTVMPLWLALAWWLTR